MSSSSPGSSAIWTPANVVTMLRICLVPIFVVAILAPWPEWFPSMPEAEAAKPWVAAVIFIVLAATDSLDGYLARSRNEVTVFGQLIDPLADKILVAAALISLVELGSLPSWPVLVILAREFIISGVRMLAASQGTVIAASWYGKAKTVFQMIAIVLFIIKDTLSLSLSSSQGLMLYVFSWVVMIIALVLTVVSLIDYVYKARFILGFGEEAKELTENAAATDAEIRELASVVVAEAVQAQVTLAAAESLTGGLICAYLTSVPGSSAVVRGGVASYATEVKHDVLAVSDDVLRENGAVSGECVAAMAANARAMLASDIAVAVSGIAGPASDESGLPAGTVWIAFASGEQSFEKLFHFEGDRDQVRLETVRAALEMMHAYCAQRLGRS